jgi:hypothetical protein
MDRDAGDARGHGDGSSCGAAPITDDAGACPVLGRDEFECMQLELGTGRDGTLLDYHRLAPGDPLWVTPGEQGLQHLLVAFRGRGFDPTLPLIETRVVRADDCVQVGYLRVRFPFKPAPEDPSLLGLETTRVVLLDDADPLQYCTILDRDVVIVSRFDDQVGHRARIELRVHVACVDPNHPLAPQWIAACNRGDAGADATTDAGADGGAATDAGADGGGDG